MDLQDIILYENEHTGLDFKATQYMKANFHSLLKDVIAMANADTKSEKFIITGVKHKPEENDVIGIEDLVDEATYQQLISDNVEPDLTIKYYSVECKGKKVGVLELLDTDNPPYMMKKPYTSNEKGKTLSAGDSWIRIGSHQKPLTRKHIDKYIANLIDKHVQDRYFSDELEVALINEAVDDNCIVLAQSMELPSHREAETIKRIIRKKEAAPTPPSFASNYFINTKLRPIFYRSTYEERDLETLRENLENVSETYKEDDLHYLYELKANKVNLVVRNKGKKYLEDASMMIIIKKCNGLYVADQIYQEPEDNYSFPSINIRALQPSWEDINYPKFDETEKDYRFLQELGDLKHGLTTQVFKVPLRIVLTEAYQQKTLSIKCMIYGKNLLSPIETNVEINIIPD